MLFTIIAACYLRVFLCNPTQTKEVDCVDPRYIRTFTTTITVISWGNGLGLKPEYLLQIEKGISIIIQ